MSLQLVKTPTGEVALVANHQLIIDGEPSDDSAKLVEQTSERLSVALEVPLEVVTIAPSRSVPRPKPSSPPARPVGLLPSWPQQRRQAGRRRRYVPSAAPS